MGLGHNTPEQRAAEPAERGRVEAEPMGAACITVIAAASESFVLIEAFSSSV
jgi:hypothetical protein